MKLKDLYKPGRKYEEYVKNGKPNINCVSCGHRLSIKDCVIGCYICGDNDRYNKCNPNGLDYLLWTPRVDYIKARIGIFVNKDEFNV